MDCSPPGSSAHGILQARYWSGLPCSPPGDLPDSGIEPTSLRFPALTGEFFTTRAACARHCAKALYLMLPVGIIIMLWLADEQARVQRETSKNLAKVTQQRGGASLWTRPSDFVAHTCISVIIVLRWGSMTWKKVVTFPSESQASVWLPQPSLWPFPAPSPSGTHHHNFYFLLPEPSSSWTTILAIQAWL